MDAVTDRGLAVPDDISVLAVAAERVAGRTEPPVTAAEVPAAPLAAAAVQALLARVESPGRRRPDVVPHAVRGSRQRRTGTGRAGLERLSNQFDPHLLWSGGPWASVSRTAIEPVRRRSRTPTSVDTVSIIAGRAPAHRLRAVLSAGTAARGRIHRDPLRLRPPPDLHRLSPPWLSPVRSSPARPARPRRPARPLPLPRPPRRDQSASAATSSDAATSVRYRRQRRRPRRHQQWQHPREAPAGTGQDLTVWDPYPQFDDSSDWVKLLNSCGTKAGVTVKRTGYDTTDLTNKTLLAAQQGNAPDVLIVDNPVVSTLAEAGRAHHHRGPGLDTSSFAGRTCSPPGQLDGKTYGVPIGANTLALYYNKTVLKAAGVDIASVKDWDSLTAALAKVKAAGKKGITFSAIGTEEGSFQFLPWFWGVGRRAHRARLAEGGRRAARCGPTGSSRGTPRTPSSTTPRPPAGRSSPPATTRSPRTAPGSWPTRRSPASTTASCRSRRRPAAPRRRPTGGEFVTIPVQKDTARYAPSRSSSPA